jgi:Tfp pilus assembly protein PilX
MFKLLLVLLVVATVSLHVVDDLTEEKIELALADRLNVEPSRRLLSNGEVKLSTSRASLSTQYPSYPASNCIDGNHNSMCHGLTNHGVSGGDTLTVYLSRTENVSRIRIINRKGCCRDRINGAEVKAGNTRCGYVPRTSAWQFDISCPNVRTDRITIRTIGRALNLEEVEVYGRSAGGSSAGGSSARTQNTVIENAPGVGGWGGSCTCPDGKIFQVGDNNDYCGSLACVGGTSGTCNRENGSWSNRKVICAAGSSPSPGPFTDGVVAFPFNHVCVSQADDRRAKRAASESALQTAKNDMGQGAVQAFMQMFVQWTPVNTMCLGNLGITDFERKAGSDTSMANLNCGFLSLPSNRNAALTNIGFSVNFRRKTPGFCSILSEQNNQMTFSMAFNQDLTDEIVQKIPKVGPLLSKFTSSEIAFGMSEGGHIAKTVRYWDGHNREVTFNAHAYIKAKISLDATKLIEEFMGGYRSRKRMPSGFIVLNNLMEAYIKFNDKSRGYIDCIFGGGECSESLLRRNLPELLFGQQVVLASQGSVDIDFGKIVGLLPKVSIDLNQSTFYKSRNGIFFKWRVPGVLQIMGDLIRKTIGKEFPRIGLGGGATFDCYIKNDEFGFKASIWGSTLDCKVYFNKKDPVHCSFKNKFFAVIMDTLEDIADAAKAVYLETANMVANSGKIIEKGAKVALDIGQDIANGVLQGVGDVTSEVTDAIEDVFDKGMNAIKNLHNPNDCHCGKSRSLRIWAAGQEYTIHNGQRKSIDWGRGVQQVWWKCGDDNDWDTKTISRPSKFWIVKMETHNKVCSSGFTWKFWEKETWEIKKDTGRSVWF